MDQAQSNVWDQLALFTKKDLLDWIEVYEKRRLPASKRKLQQAAKTHKHNENMLAGLKAEAERRGL